MDTVITLETATATSKAPNALWRFAGLTGRVLMEPARFFREELGRFTLSEALTFGIANAWMAATLAFFFETINSFLLVQVLERWMQRILVSEEGFSLFGLSADSFLYTSGALLLGPFLFLLRLAFSAGSLFVFARLFIEDNETAREPVTYSGSMRIQSIALLSNWFSVVPVFGSFIAFLVSLILSVTGVRERYGVSTRRATAVVLAPYVLLGFFAFCLALFGIFLFSQIPLQELLDLDPEAFGG